MNPAKEALTRAVNRAIANGAPVYTETKPKFWAKRRKRITGPHETREAAVSAFVTKYPFRGKDYEARAVKNQIMTGYGGFGPHFDLRWHTATGE